MPPVSPPSKPGTPVARALPALAGRVLLLGDVHAEDETLAWILATQQREDELGQVLCVGDIADGRGDLARTVDLLAAHGVDCVRGNHDRWAVAGAMRQLPDAHDLTPPAREFLASLPITRRYATPLGELLLCHAIGDDDMSVIEADTPPWMLERIDAWVNLQSDAALRLVVAGHTHAVMCRTMGPWTLLNPGTLRLGQRAEGEARWPSWGVLDLEQARFEHWERVEGPQTGDEGGGARRRLRQSWSLANGPAAST